MSGSAEVGDSLSLVPTARATADPGGAGQRHADRRTRAAGWALDGPRLKGLTTGGTAHESVGVG